MLQYSYAKFDYSYNDFLVQPKNRDVNYTK